MTNGPGERVMDQEFTNLGICQSGRQIREDFSLKVTKRKTLPLAPRSLLSEDFYHWNCKMVYLC